MERVKDGGCGKRGGKVRLADRLGVVSRIAGVTSASLGLGELMRVAYDAVAPFFAHEAFLVLQHQRATDSLRLLFGMEGGGELDEVTVSLDGFGGVVVRQDRPLYVPDMDDRDPSLPAPILFGPQSPIGSWLGVPLRIRGQAVGVLAIAAGARNAYDEDDQRLLCTVADQLAVAMDNARLFEETRRQAERFALLNRVSHAVSATLDVEELLDALYREIASTFDHDRFVVIRHDAETNELETFYAVEGGSRLPPERTPFGGLAGVVIADRRVLHVRDHAAEREHLPPVARERDGRSAPASWLGAPLTVGDRVLGALCIMVDRPGAYDREKEHLFVTLADQIAFALSNAELYQSVRDAAERLAIVNRIGRAVGREHDLGRLAETVYREIAPVFEADTFFIALYNEEEATIEFPFMVDEGNRIDADPVAFGEGLTSTVIRTMRPLHVRNSREYARVTGTPTLYGSMKTPETWLGIPLVAQGRPIGIMNVQSYEPNAYTEDQALLFATLADQIVMSFEKARLLRSAQRELEERTRAEDRLAAERTLLRTIIDNLPDFIYAKDLEGRFVVANTAIARFYGHAHPDDLLGRAIGDLLPADDASPYLEEERRILASRQPMLNQEERVVDRSSEAERWLLVTKLPLPDGHGKIAGLVGIDRDITARKLAEEEVRRYLAEVEVANEEVKQFAYIVSHDLRSPLVNLKGFSAELKDAMRTLAPHLERMIEQAEGGARRELVAVVEQDIPEALGFIDTSVTRMDGFINSVLKLSRLGRRELTLQPVDVGTFVETCRQSLAHQIEERDVELVVGDLPEVVADPTAMEQIIGNLVTNAVNYLDTTRAGRIEIGGERTTLTTRFWIKDNGRGIAKEDEEKVFAPFRRAGKQDVAGEGMGLSYVRTMVRQHGGQIWFESEPNVGTTFYFTIAAHLEKGKSDGQAQ